MRHDIQVLADAGELLLEELLEGASVLVGVPWFCQGLCRDRDQRWKMGRYW